MLVVLLKVPMLIVCAQVDLVGRELGPRLMSVATFKKPFLSPGTTYLGTVLGPPIDTSTDKQLSTKVLLLSLAIGSEVTALPRAATSTAAITLSP